MKPTLIKKCLYRPNPDNDYEVIIRTDPDSSCKLKKYLSYALVYEDDKYLIMIKNFFASDGGSIPRLVWTLLGITPFDVRCVYGFFIHDFLYSSHLVSQLEADQILSNIIDIDPGLDWFRIWVIYRTLRLCGWKAYDGKTPEDIAKACSFGKVERKDIDHK